MVFVCQFLAMVFIHHWSLHCLDITNVFLHGKLQEVYIDQPLGFTASGDSRLVCKLIGPSMV